jgi:hypothetical protein
LPDFDRQEFISPERGIDSQRKQAQVAGFISQDFFDIGDVPF